MRLLLLLAGALVLAVALLLYSRVPRGAGVAQPVAGTPSEQEEAAQLEAPVFAAELEHAPAPVGREEVGEERRSITGRVDVAGGLPASADALVVGHSFRPGVSRFYSQRVEARVQADGSFELEVPLRASSVELDLESPVLYLADEIDAKPGARDVVLRPEVRALLRGRVHGIDPGAGSARIDFSTEKKGNGYAESDAAGSFSIPLAPVDEPIELAAGAARSEAKIQVDPLFPGEVRSIDLYLEPWTAPHGVVLDEHGVPIEGARVRVGDARFEDEFVADGKRHSFRKFYRSAAEGVTTRADGRFQLEELAPGAWTILVWARGFGAGRKEIQLPADAQGELEIVLARPGIVRGRVLTPDGAPCADALVTRVADRPAHGVIVDGEGHRMIFVDSLDPSDPDSPQDVPTARTDAEGRFALPIDAGVIRLTAGAPGLAPSKICALTLASGEERSGVELVLRRACTLHARVRQESGANARLFLRLAFEDGNELRLFAGDDGTFGSDELPPGHVRIVPDGYLDYEGAVEAELDPEAAVEVELHLVRSPAR